MNISVDPTGPRWRCGAGHPGGNRRCPRHARCWPGFQTSSPRFFPQAQEGHVCWRLSARRAGTGTRNGVEEQTAAAYIYSTVSNRVEPGISPCPSFVVFKSSDPESLSVRQT